MSISLITINITITYHYHLRRSVPCPKYSTTSKYYCFEIKWSCNPKMNNAVYRLGL